MNRCLAALRSRCGSGCAPCACTADAPAIISSTPTPRSRMVGRVAPRARLGLVMFVASVRAGHNTQARTWKSCAKADIFLTNFLVSSRDGCRWSLRIWALPLGCAGASAVSQRTARRLDAQSRRPVGRSGGAQGEPVGKQELLYRVWPDAVG